MRHAMLAAVFAVAAALLMVGSAFAHQALEAPCGMVLWDSAPGFAVTLKNIDDGTVVATYGPFGEDGPYEFSAPVGTWAYQFNKPDGSLDESAHGIVHVLACEVTSSPPSAPPSSTVPSTPPTAPPSHRTPPPSDTVAETPLANKTLYTLLVVGLGLAAISAGVLILTNRRRP